MFMIDDQENLLEDNEVRLQHEREALMEEWTTSHHKRPWKKICRAHATGTSDLAWETYELLLDELTQMLHITERLDAANSGTLENES
jgi:hypothetical protein